MQPLIEEEMEDRVQEPKVKTTVRCKLFITNLDRKSPQRVRLFVIPHHWSLLELKYKVAELYQRTFHADLKNRRNLELLYRDEENDLIIFDTEEEWQMIKNMHLVKDQIKIVVDMDKGGSSKTYFIPKRVTVKKKNVPKPSYNPPVSSVQPLQSLPVVSNVHASTSQSSVMYPSASPVVRPEIPGLTPDRIEKIMNKLYEMGFSDREKNLVAIYRYKGDLNLILGSGQLHPSTN